MSDSEVQSAPKTSRHIPTQARASGGGGGDPYRGLHNYLKFFGVPYYSYSRMGPKTLLELLRSRSYPPEPFYHLGLGVGVQGVGFMLA